MVGDEYKLGQKEHNDIYGAGNGLVMEWMKGINKMGLGRK